MRVRPAADAKGIRLEKRVAPRAGITTGDAARLQQVIWNLLANAVKFTPSEGRVEVTLQRAGAHVDIVVADTGQGIAPALRPYVFDRFLQADGSSTRAHAGLGLGLALVKHLVELHGGSVAVESPGEGAGATFTVRLPVRPADGSPPPARGTGAAMAASDPDVRLAGLRILVVDDEPDALDVTSEILSRAGATVRGCRSASEALAMVADWRPDVLLSDIEMPGEDGYALIRKVRALEPELGGKVPAVALTAYGRPQDRMLALTAGYSMHVPKPVDPGELTAIIDSVAGRSSVTAE